MFRIAQVQKVVPELVDVLCDACGKICEGEPGFGNEFLTLSASWGYSSDWDGEQWQAHLCQACVRAHLLPLVKFHDPRDDKDGASLGLYGDRYRPPIVPAVQLG